MTNGSAPNDDGGDAAHGGQDMTNGSATNDAHAAWLREQVRGGLLASSLALSRLLETEMDRALAIVPLTASGLVVLLEIAQRPPATQRELAARLHESPGSISETLARLEAWGMIRRPPAPPKGGSKGGPRGLTAVLTRRGTEAMANGVDAATRVELEWAQRLMPPAGGRPIGEHPTGGHPTGEHPISEHPTGEHPTGGHPIGGHSIGQRPGTGQPDARRPAISRRYGLLRWLTECERDLRRPPGDAGATPAAAPS